jgi:lipopolysaccharide transport system ATP-binding protein
MSVYRSERWEPGQPQIELHKVSQRYELQRTHQRSLQESFIRLFRHNEREQSEFWPLREISFSIGRGESVGIIGPNGSGKSTLLKVLSGVITPTEGDLYINGRISSLLELGAGFHPELTGRENIYLNGSIYGFSRAQMNKRIDGIMRYAELGDFIDTPVKHYSSGMYVRLGFAVAIQTTPDLLLVDEVLAVGDSSFQRKCLASIQHFRDRGGTLILVSHDLNTIQSICRRVIWLEQGELRADGHPTDVIMAYTQHVMEKEGARDRKRAAEHPPADGASDPGQNGMAQPAPVRRWGSGRVRITKVELADDQGEPRNRFRTGDALTIQISYETEEPVEQPVFGIAIYHQSGTHLSGPNTKFGGLPIPRALGAGVVNYRVPALALLEGTYLLSVAVVDQADSETYDYHDRLYPFHVYRGGAGESYGLVTLNGSWSHKPSAVMNIERRTQNVEQ